MDIQVAVCIAQSDTGELGKPDNIISWFRCSQLLMFNMQLDARYEESLAIKANSVENEMYI